MHSRRPNELQIDPRTWAPWPTVLAEIEDIWGPGCIQLDRDGLVPFDDGTNPAVRFLTTVAQTHGHGRMPLPPSAPFLVAATVKHFFRLHDGATDKELLKWARMLMALPAQRLDSEDYGGFGVILGVLAGYAARRQHRIESGNLDYLPSRRFDRVFSPLGMERADEARDAGRIDNVRPSEALEHLESLPAGACLILGPTTGASRPRDPHRALLLEIVAEFSAQRASARWVCDKHRGDGAFERLSLDAQMKRAVGRDGFDAYKAVTSDAVASSGGRPRSMKPDGSMSIASWAPWPAVLQELQAIFRTETPIDVPPSGTIEFRTSDPLPMLLLQVLYERGAASMLDPYDHARQVATDAPAAVARAVRHYLRLRAERPDIRVVYYAAHLLDRLREMYAPRIECEALSRPFEWLAGYAAIAMNPPPWWRGTPGFASIFGGRVSPMFGKFDAVWRTHAEETGATDAFEIR